MKRWTFFAYGVFCHVLFLATYAYMACFVSNVFVTITIDTVRADTGTAVMIDIILIVLFCLQHSVMARPWFKQSWMRLVPEAIERSTYVLLSCVVVVLLMWLWQGLGGIVWNVESSFGRTLIWVLFGLGWLMVPAVSLMINHFDLMGTRQVWLYLNGRPYTALPFRTPWFYDRMRHPLYVGWALAFWAIPTMTVGHLLFASTLSIYMVIAARIEERDLVSYFGEAYRKYQGRVPMFLPRLGKGEKAMSANSETPEFTR